MTDTNGAEVKNESNKGDKIIKQIEYYFGDINLPRDKFLQEEMKKDNGWVPLSTMLKFNRLAAITTSVDEIAAALHDSHLVDISDDKQKIRRNPDVPLPENTLEYWQEIKRRTVYLRGFPQDTTLDEISAFVGQFGTVQNIVMRKTKGGKETPRVFKGSVFATYATQDEAKAVATKKELKFKDAEEPLLNQMQDDYFANKNLERHQKKELKKGMRKTQIDQQNKQHYKKGMVLKVGGLDAKDKEGEEKQEPARINELKDFFGRFGKPMFVVVDGTEATIRFGGQEEGAARVAWQKAQEGAASTEGGADASVGVGDSAKVVMNGQELSGTILEGEAESKYWADFDKAILETKQQRQKGGHRGKDNKAGGKKFERKDDRNRKRRADRGNGHGTKDGGPKGKRTVFEEDGAEELGGEKTDKQEGENGGADEEPVKQKKPKVEEA